MQKLRITHFVHDSTITEAIYVDGKPFVEDINEDIFTTFMGKLMALGMVDYELREMELDGDELFTPDEC